MKRCLVLVLTLLLLTTASALAAKQADRDSQSLGVANRALEGRRAIVELKDGARLAGVRQVFIGPEVTTWEIAGETRQIATADIQRIALTKRSRIRKWSRRGLIVGAIVGSVGGGYSETDGFFLEPLDASEMAKGAVTGAAVGAAAGAIAGDRVVFEAN